MNSLLTLLLAIVIWTALAAGGVSFALLAICLGILALDHLRDDPFPAAPTVDRPAVIRIPASFEPTLAEIRQLPTARTRRPV